MAVYQSMHPLARSTMRRQIALNAARDEAEQRKACLFVAKLLARCRSWLAAQCVLAAVTWLVGDPA